MKLEIDSSKELWCPLDINGLTYLLPVDKCQYPNGHLGKKGYHSHHQKLKQNEIEAPIKRNTLTLIKTPATAVKDNIVKKTYHGIEQRPWIQASPSYETNSMSLTSRSLSWGQA